jgi:DNA-binding response OmpR family regulator
MIERPLIALVNDDARFLGLASDLLGRHGFRTALYTLRDDVYVDLRLSRPELIVISLSSERPVAAWQLLNLLRLDGSTAALPAILCSPDVRMLADKVVRLRAMGCDVLEEPFTERGLLTKVRLTLAKVAQRGHEA